jgi:hypothetical protein
MAKEDLTLDTGLIRKGEARGVSPTVATSVPVPVEQPAEDQDPPLRAAPPDDVPKRFTSFRLPVSLDEDLRGMMFETRRSKQDLLIEFVTEGIRKWRTERLKRG